MNQRSKCCEQFGLDQSRSFLYTGGTTLPARNFQAVWQTDNAPLIFYTGDVNGDGKNEIVASESCAIEKSLLTVWDAQMRPLWRKEFSPPAWLNILADVDADGRQNILLMQRQHRGFHVLVLSGQGELVKRIPINDDERIGGIGVGAVVDLDGDGNLQLVVTMCESGETNQQGIYQPRGIAVYDYPTGRELWHYLIASHVSRATPYITDFNGDGKLELLLGMYSPDNGGIMNDMDDSHVYLVALDNAGNHLWTTEPLGGYFMCSIAAFMENSESAEKIILAASHANIPFRDDCGMFVALDAQGDIIHREEFNTGVCAIVSDDIDGDDSPEVILGLSNGQVRILDAQFEKKHCFELRAPVHESGITLADVDSDGLCEIITATQDGAIWLLDMIDERQSRCLGEKPHFVPNDTARLRGEIWVSDLDGTGIPTILANREQKISLGGKVPRELVRLQPLPTLEFVREMIQTGDVPSRLTECGKITEFVWAPDDERIACIRGKNLCVTDDMKILTECSDCENPVWAPDSSHIVFVRREGERKNIWRVAADGADLQQLTTDNSSHSPDFSPDGERIAFCSARDGRNAIWVMNSDGSHQEPLLLSGQVDALTPHWHPEGNKIFFLQTFTKEIAWKTSTIQHLMQMNLQNGQITDLTSDESLKEALMNSESNFDQNQVNFWFEQFHEISANVLKPVYSPFGNAIACTLRITYTCGLNTLGEIPGFWILDFVNGTWKRLFTFEGENVYNATWAPFGTLLAFEGVSEQRRQTSLWLADALGENQRRLVSGTHPRWNPLDPFLLAFLQDGDIYTIQFRAHETIPGVAPQLHVCYIVDECTDANLKGREFGRQQWHELQSSVTFELLLIISGDEQELIIEEIQVDGQPIPIKKNSLKGLLYLLACHAPHPIELQTLMDELHINSKKHINNLVSQLRKHLHDTARGKKQSRFITNWYGKYSLTPGVKFCIARKINT